MNFERLHSNFHLPHPINFQTSASAVCFHLSITDVIIYFVFVLFTVCVQKAIGCAQQIRVVSEQALLQAFAMMIHVHTPPVRYIYGYEGEGYETQTCNE